MRKLIFLCLIGSMLIVGACSNIDDAEDKTEESEQPITSVNDGSMGDLHEATANVDTLPPFLTNHHDTMKMLYTAVGQHKELLEHIPCYCGCGESVGHEHNYHCFIHDHKTDGSVVWDDHATRCQVCLDIAAESIIEYQEGKSIDDIRDAIDAQYKDDGYPEPTPTKRYAS